MKHLLYLLVGLIAFLGLGTMIIMISYGNSIIFGWLSTTTGFGSHEEGLFLFVVFIAIIALICLSYHFGENLLTKRGPNGRP